VSGGPTEPLIYRGNTSPSARRTESAKEAPDEQT
jgi:hypothetical protein